MTRLHTRLIAAALLSATLSAPAAFASDAFNKFPAQASSPAYGQAHASSNQSHAALTQLSGTTTVVRRPVQMRQTRTVKRVVHPVGQPVASSAAAPADSRFNKMSAERTAVRTAMPVLFSERAPTSR